MEDQFLIRKDIGSLDKALFRRYQQKLVKHKRNLENRLNRRQQTIKGKLIRLLDLISLLAYYIILMRFQHIIQ